MKILFIFALFYFTLNFIISNPDSNQDLHDLLSNYYETEKVRIVVIHNHGSGVKNEILWWILNFEIFSISLDT